MDGYKTLEKHVDVCWECRVGMADSPWIDFEHTNLKLYIPLYTKRMMDVWITESSSTVTGGSLTRG